MTHTRFEDLKQRRLDRMTDSERAEFERLLAEQVALSGRASTAMTREERRSLGFALRVVEHLRSDPDGTVSVARAQLARQLHRATENELPWLGVWDSVLDLPIGSICDVLSDEGQFARDLRQSSPMSVVLDDVARQEVIRSTR
jgi:hypothetical protein